MEVDTLDLVNAAIAGDKDSVVAAFNASIAAKVTDALELKKVEVASNLLGTEETENEFQTLETETDGSTDAAADAAAESELSTDEG